MFTHAIPVSSNPSLGVLPNGRAHRVPARAPVAASPPVSARGWARLPIQLLAAAIVLLALGLGYRAFGPGGDDRSSTTIPAAVAPAATPAPEETLLEVELPAEAMPYGDKVDGRAQPPDPAANGGTATWGPESGACCPGIRVDYVLYWHLFHAVQHGRLGRPRRGSNLDGVAAGADLVLGPGDTSIFQNEATVTYANSGPDPVEMLFWIVFDGVNGEYSTEDPIPAGAAIHDSDIRFTLPSIPFGPALVRLRLVELAPEERLAPPDGAIQFAVTLHAEHLRHHPLPRTESRRRATARRQPRLGGRPRLRADLGADQCAGYSNVLGSACFRVVSISKEEEPTMRELIYAMRFTGQATPTTADGTVLKAERPPKLHPHVDRRPRRTQRSAAGDPGRCGHVRVRSDLHERDRFPRNRHDRFGDGTSCASPPSAAATSAPAPIQPAARHRDVAHRERRGAVRRDERAHHLQLLRGR